MESYTMNNNHERFAKIVIIILMMGVVLTVLYFTYTANVEKKGTLYQVEHVVDNLMNDMSVLNLDPSLSLYIKEQIPKIHVSTSDMENDVNIKNVNEKLQKNSIIMAGVMLGCVLLFILLIFKFLRHKVSIKNIIGDSIVIISAIVLVEIFFATYFGSKFLNIDANHIKYVMLYYFMHPS